MTNAPKTLLSMVGAAKGEVDLAAAALVLIDCQHEYLEGPLRLSGVEAAAAEAGRAADAMRGAGGAVIHIRHQGKAGGAFDLEAQRGGFMPDCTPQQGEVEILKTLPNSFWGTTLGETLTGVAPQKALFAGFMGHMCISVTVRAALDLGYGPSIVLARACATRDLPGPDGETVPAASLRQAAMAALGDRFAFIVPDIAAV